LAKYRKARKKDAAHQILLAAVSLLAFGSALLLASVYLASSPDPALQAAARGFLKPLPYALIPGALLWVASFFMRNPEDTPRPRPKAEPLVFGASTTTFAEPRIVGTPGADAERERRFRERPRAQSWSERVFDDIEWRRFEAVCESLFSQAGFQTESQSHGADGGMDIWLYSTDSQGPTAVVQCKHWRGKQVGIKEMRDFLGVMSSHGLKRGTYATSSTFTDEALPFAKENGIIPLDGAALLALIRNQSPEQQIQLLEVAHEGDYWRPTCSSCGKKMVERATRQGGTAFWGCVDYPRCEFTMPMRAA
jgi:restriction system protein